MMSKRQLYRQIMAYPAIRAVRPEGLCEEGAAADLPLVAQ